MIILRTMGNGLYSAGQTIGWAVVRTKELRNDPEFFLKAAQVAFSILELAILNNPGFAYLSKFCFVLKTANMHDFYRVIQQPRQWFFPLTVDSINEKKVLKDLYSFVEKYVTQAAPMPQGGDVILRNLLKQCLTDQLTQMNNCGDAYRNFDDFKKVLQTRMQALPTNQFDLSQIDLKSLVIDKKVIRHTPLLEKIVNINWAIVDVGCFGLFFQEWGLFEPVKIANAIGIFPLFQWVKNHALDKWVVGLVLSAFTLKLLESVRKLRDDKLTPQVTTQARWNVITSFAETVLYGAIYLKIIGKLQIGNVPLLAFAIVAKSLGALSIALRPKHEFFQ